MKKKPHQIKKPDTDFNEKFNKYPQENSFNHPIIIKSTIWGALFAGILVAVIAWLFSAGIIIKEEPLILSSINAGTFTFIGFITGSAAGGLIGNVLGIFLMLKEKG